MWCPRKTLLQLLQPSKGNKRSKVPKPCLTSCSMQYRTQMVAALQAEIFSKLLLQQVDFNSNSSLNLVSQGLCPLVNLNSHSSSFQLVNNSNSR